MLERVWRKGNPLTLLVGMQTSTATMENSAQVYQTSQSEEIIHLLMPKYKQYKSLFMGAGSPGF